MKKMTAALLALLLALLWTPALGEEAPAEEPTNPYVCITVKGYGSMYAELYPDTAPITVENFLKLVRAQFYDGLTFHRIISGFMIQGGDPLGNGTGGSGENIKGEFSANGVDNPLLHTRGVLSMARSQAMDSASSQFFIMHAAASHLDGQYAAFGQVISGLWIVDKICQIVPVQDNNGTVAKADQPVIESIREAEREEALQAQRAEAENGRAGTVYQDPMTPLSFPVPEGWNLTSDTQARALFRKDGEESRLIYILRMDQWSALPEAGKQQLAEQNITQQDLHTARFKKELFSNLTGISADQLQEETRSGSLFYTAEKTDANSTVTYYAGAENGVIYAFLFNAGRTDPAFADLEAILDQLTLK